MRGLFTLVVLLALVGGGGYAYYRMNNATPAPKWTTDKVTKGNLDLTIRSTGTIEPESVIDVGAQVQGLIKDLGIDSAQATKAIDYNSKVDAGTVLAHIDDSIYKAQFDQAKANLALGVANLQNNQAKLKQVTNDFERAKLLWNKHAQSDQDFDAAESAYESAVATVDQAAAQVEQSKAALAQAQTNLDYTVIKSPVKGTVIDRRVNVGQTVVASLSAPSLFLIAEDLKKMQIWASVNEADIGRINLGQSANFTVDTFPTDTFKGTVSQIRLNATSTQNVVLYTVVIDVDNSDQKLIPYLTATLQFDAGRHDNILMVPNAALRWRPRPEFIDPEVRDKYSKRAHAPTTQSPGAAPAAKKPDPAKKDHGTMWVVDGQWLKPVRVQTGVTDGAMTEIVSSDLKEGTEIVTGEDHEAVDTGATVNPFAPKVFGGKKN